MFDEMLDAIPATTTSSSPASLELQAYLAAPVDPSVRDALKWWYDHRFEYPHLSRMARDYHSIPPTSVDVERVFSRGRILLSHLRNCMSAETTCLLMCLNAWFKAGIIKRPAVHTAIRKAPTDEVVEGNGEVMDLD